MRKHHVNQNNLAVWSIYNPVPVALFFIVLLVLGVYNLTKLPVQDFPDIEFPVVTVSVSSPGAAASQIETEITKKIEDVVFSLDKVDNIQSTINVGSSTTVVQFDLDKDINLAVDEIKDAIATIRQNLPNDLPQEPLVKKVSTAGNAILTYTVEGAGKSEEDLSWLIDNTIATRISGVKGVGSVARQGGVSRIVRVDLHPSLLAYYGITPSIVAQQMKSMQNEFVGGTANIGEGTQTIRVIHKAKVAKDLEALPLPLPNGSQIRLGDVATVEDTIDTRNQGAFKAEKAVVTFQVKRGTGYGEKEVADKVAAEVAQLNADLPNIKITELTSVLPRVNRSFSGSMAAMLEGCALAILVIWLFLRDNRTTLVSAIALPLSILPTFAFMAAFGFTLNTLTFLALTLIIGVLVDDAIVEVENISRHMHSGKYTNKLQAIKTAVTEIGLAVVATSATLIAVFLPTAFMGGVPGRFFKQFGWTAAVAVFMSLLVARLLTPLLCVWLLKDTSQVKKADPAWLTWYMGFIEKALGHSKTTIVVTVLFLVASVGLALQLPKSFIPPEDQGQITVTLTLPPGTSFDQAVKVAERTREMLKPVKDVQFIYTGIGAGAVQGRSGPAQQGGSKLVSTVSLLLQLTPYGERDRKQTEIELEVSKILEQMQGITYALGVGAAGEKLTISFAGNRPSDLEAVANALMDELKAGSQFGNITSSAQQIQPELRVVPDITQMAQAGVTLASLSQVLRVATGEDIETNMPKFSVDERQIPIKIRLPESFSTNLDSLLELRIPAKAGYVPLSSVASLAFDSSESQIQRMDKQRVISVMISLSGMPVGEALGIVNATQTMQALPEGVSVQDTGELKRMGELFSSFGLAMLLGIGCILIVLVLLFKDVFQPVTIMMGLPLSAGGAFGALVLAQYPLSLPVLIGLLMLIGIVTKNSILLVDYVVMARRDFGMDRRTAILDACHKRARPIVMTSVAMIAGMLPLVFNTTDAFKSPMGTVVVGGLITSTILSLVVIPVLYALVDKVKDSVLPNRSKEKRLAELSA